MNNYSDIKIGKLIHQMKLHQYNVNDGITLFLGAGCSLASSQKDISTWGIVHDIVNNHLGNTSYMPQTWVELYKTFVNVAWNGLGRKDKINLLQPYFDNLEPSEGYYSIKYLIENGYIQNIITTNFDPLIDIILEKTPHRIIVGEKEMVSGSNPKITFIKAHGDLKYGDLRFSPYELQKLPQELENRIWQLTNGIVIVIGYRGQDIGVMNSLNTSDDHCAFWVSPSKPEIYDGYNNEPIYQWMKKRNSDDNFIYGEYGDFNILLPTIVKKISISPNQDSQDIELWKNSFLYDTISLSKRISLVFSILLEIENELLSSYEWEVKAPYFSSDSASLLSVLINICQDKVLPQNSITSIGNGIEALLLAFALDIFARMQGFPIAISEYIENIRKKYEVWVNAPKLNDNFWILLKRLFMGDIRNDSNFFEITLTFDINKDFSYVLKKGEFSEIQSLFTMIKVIALFENTACSKSKIASYEYRAKMLLENNCKKIEPTTHSTNIMLEDLNSEDHHLLHRYLLDMYSPLHKVLGMRNIYLIDKIYIEYEIDNKLNRELGLYDEFVQKSHEYFRSFSQYVNLNTFIVSDTINLLDDFLVSMNSGLMLLGPSGSGKTTILGYWIKELQFKESVVVLPFAGKEQRLTQKGVNVFSNWLSDPLLLEDINNVFFCRKQTLVLIYDGLNEIPGDFNSFQENYNEFIVFTEILSKNKYCNIKVILSLRTDSYLQLKQNKAVEPKPGVFYTTFSGDGKGSSLYQIPSFSAEQAIELLEKETKMKTKNIKNMYHQFSGLLQTPFYIHLFGQILNSFTDFNEKEFAAFSLKWYEILLDNITKNKEENERLSDLIEKIVLVKYRYSSRNIFLNDITSKTNVLCKQTEKDILKLQTSGILIYDSVSGQIEFSHDTYEQIFLTKYLVQIDNPDMFCASIFEKQKSPTILLLALKDYLRLQRVDSVDSYLTILLRFCSQNCLTLTQNLIKLIIKVQEENPIENFWEKFFEKIDFNIGLSYHSKILTTILSKINEFLDEKLLFGIELLDMLNPIIYPSNNDFCIISNEEQAFYEYIYAKYLYTFSYEFEKDVFSKAKMHCNKARQLLFDSKEIISLHDDINFLYSILLRYEGKLNEAVDILKKILENQMKHLVPDRICKTALELGAIYRELTNFNEAMDLYKRIENTCSLSPHWNTRLKLNTGIIYKNKLQLKIREKNISKKDYANYKIAEDLFKYVYQYSKTSNDILLQLEIQAELIELCAIAEYFNIDNVKSARNYITEMEYTLKKYPIPLRQIQYYRMLARVYLLEKKYDESLHSLKTGFQLSITYNIPYRACDCCRKFAQIVLEYKSLDILLVEEAIQYIDYALNYYKCLNTTQHIYFIEAQKLKEQLYELKENQSLI